MLAGHDVPTIDRKDLVAPPEKGQLRQMSEKDQMTIREIKGMDYSQVEISTKADSPDPRVGGTRIVFDSRLDESPQ